MLFRKLQFWSPVVSVLLFPCFTLANDGQGIAAFDPSEYSSTSTRATTIEGQTLEQSGTYPAAPVVVGIYISVNCARNAACRNAAKNAAIRAGTFVAGTVSKNESADVDDEIYGVGVGEEQSTPGTTWTNYPGSSGDPDGDYEALTGERPSGKRDNGKGPNGENVSIYPDSSLGGTSIQIRPRPGERAPGQKDGHPDGVKIRYD